MTGYQAYRGLQVEGAGPLELVLLTYDALIKALVKARAAVEAKDMVAEAEQLSRALQAIIELSTSLNFESGGNISASLASLYAYMSRRLLEGQTRNSAAAIDEVLSLTQTLREGWQGLSSNAPQSGSLQVAVA